MKRRDLTGRLDWKGDDPTVVFLDDNGARYAQLRVGGERCELAIVVRDVPALIAELQAAHEWTLEPRKPRSSSVPLV